MQTDDTPDGDPPNRIMRDAVLRQLHGIADDGEGGTTEKFHLVARRLVDKAVDGDMTAIKEVLDRIDGKSVQGATPDEGPVTATVEWKDSASASSPPTSLADSLFRSTPAASASPAS